MVRDGGRRSLGVADQFVARLVHVLRRLDERELRRRRLRARHRSLDALHQARNDLVGHELKARMRTVRFQTIA